MRYLIILCVLLAAVGVVLAVLGIASASNPYFVSLKGEGGKIDFIKNNTNITEVRIKFSAWERDDTTGKGTLEVLGKINGKWRVVLNLNLKFKNAITNTDFLLEVNNSATGSVFVTGKGTKKADFSSVIWRYSLEENIVKVYNSEFSVSDIPVTRRFSG